ncbi:amidase [Aliishimia ponticola]|uniref:Amidase n=1 Tax=Aliishimia ponticola TaxID=2499833 RepID=A0A4S4NBU3_9RHOB|nr:amidase [Aliishimia ponticola]THH36145.1 amidase [Aliishimia ponticola]
MLNREEWTRLDLVGLAELAQSGAVSRREILQTAIREIERLNPALNAVNVTQFEQALDRADDAPDSARFAGLPYLVKDLHAPVKGLPLSNGSARFKGTVFDFDSTTVSRLRGSGLRFLGRTASPEFGLSLATESEAWGITRNPWNRDRGAGGSSGGSASAVASGMLPAAHATDSAGSIRIPAAFNGLVGFKPTRALNAFGPHRGDPNFGMSHEHAVSRTVRDSAALLDITAGPDAGCPYFTAKPDQPFETLIQTPPGQLKIGFVTTQFHGDAVHPESRKAVEATAKTLQDLGHIVTPAMPQFNSLLLTNTMIRLLMGSLAGLFVGTPMGQDTELEGFQEITKQAIRFSQETTLGEHLQRAAIINEQVRALAQYFNTYDVLLTPATNGPAPEHGVLRMDQGALDDFLDRLFAISPFSATFNASGQPAISLPVHQTADHMPVGIQFVGRFAEDATLLQLSAQLEAASDWNTLAPDPDMSAA